MYIKGDHLGIDAQTRQVSGRKTEQAEGVKNERKGQASQSKGSRSDAIQISQEGRDLQSQALGRQIEATPGQPAVEATSSEPALPARLLRIQEKLEQGFYESQEVLETVTQRLLQDLGVPAPDSQETSREDRP